MDGLDGSQTIAARASLFEHTANYSIPSANYQVHTLKYQKHATKYTVPYTKYGVQYTKYAVPYTKFTTPYAMYSYTHTPTYHIRSHKLQFFLTMNAF